VIELATWQKAAKLAKFGVLDKDPEEVCLFFEIPELNHKTVQHMPWVASVSNTSSIRSAVLIQHRLVVDRHTLWYIPRYAYALHSGRAATEIEHFTFDHTSR